MNMAVTCAEKTMLRKLLLSENELSNINFERLKKGLIYIKKLVDSDEIMYLTVDSLIHINNIVAGLDNILLERFMLSQMDVITCLWIRI